MTKVPIFSALVASAALCAGGCASSRPMVNEWRNPAYDAVSFGPILIGALGGDASTRRTIENEFIAQLRELGVVGATGYGNVSASDDGDESKIQDAARSAGVDGVILARLVKVEEKTDYRGSAFPPVSFGIFGSHVGGSVSGLGGAPIAYRYNEYTTNLTLRDVVKNETVWSATTVTNETATISSAIKSAVAAAVKSLTEKNLLRRQPQTK